MPTVTGAGNVHPNITAGTNYSVGQQASAVIQNAATVQVTMTAGGGAPAVLPGQTGALIIDASGSFIGGGFSAATYRFFIVGDTNNSVSVTGGGALGQAVILGTGPVVFNTGPVNTGGGSGTIVGGDGNKTINTGNGTNFGIYTGADDDTINLASSRAAGQDTVSAGYGRNLVNLGAAPTQILSTGADTINVSTGSTTVQAMGLAQTSIAGGSGARTLVNGAGSATVYGGTGSATVVGGVGGGQFYGGTAGNNLFIGGSGLTYLTGGGQGDVLIATSASTRQFLQAGAGNETLLGSLSTMDNLFTAGSGSDLIIAGPGNDTIYGGAGSSTVTGGAGADVFTFNTFFARGGNVTITDFTPGTDHVALQNYGDVPANLATAAQLIAPGTSKVTLSDGTGITFLGIGSIDKSFFV